MTALVFHGPVSVVDGTVTLTIDQDGYEKLTELLACTACVGTGGSSSHQREGDDPCYSCHGDGFVVSGVPVVLVRPERGGFGEGHRFVDDPPDLPAAVTHHGTLDRLQLVFDKYGPQRDLDYVYHLVVVRDVVAVDPPITEWDGGIAPQGSNRVHTECSVASLPFGFSVCPPALLEAINEGEHPKALIVILSSFLLVGCWPDESSTGPDPTPVTACSVPDLGDGGTHTLADCTVDELLVTNGTDLTLTRVLFNGGGQWALDARWGAGTVTVTDCEIAGAYTEGAIRAAADSTHIEGCDIHGLTPGADGIKAYSGAYIRENYIHDLGSAGHGDGIQIEAPVANVTILGNHIVGGNNAAIQLSPENPSADGDGPVEIIFNRLACDGCEYTLRIYSDLGHVIDGVEAGGNFIEGGSTGFIETNYSTWSRHDNYDYNSCDLDEAGVPITATCGAV